jgi:hypothetical protein
MAEDSNWTSWALSAAAGAAGGYYSIKNQFGSLTNAYNKFTTSQQSVRSSGTSAAKSTIQQVVSSQININQLNEIQHTLLKGRLDRLTQKISKSQNIPGLGAALSREWEMAKASSLPTGLEVGFSISSNNALDDISKILDHGSNRYMGEIFSKFSSNVETMLSTGEFSPLKNITAPVRDQLKLITDLPPGINSTASALSNIFHERVNVFGKGPGSELEFRLPGDKRSLFKLEQAFGPEGMDPGLVRTSGHNIYAPGMFARMNETGDIGQPMNWTEFKSQELLKAAEEARARNQSVEQAISSRSKELSKLMDYTEPSLTGTDLSLESIAKSQRLTVLDETGSPIKGMAAQNFLVKKGGTLLPTNKPGTFSTLNPSEIYGAFSDSISFERKPGQWIKEFRPSESAQAAIRGGVFGSQTFDFMDSPMAIKQFNGPSGPRLKTLYLDDNQIETLRRYGFPVGDGELLVNSRFKKQAEVTRRRRVTLSEISEGFNNKYLYTKSQGGMPDVDNLLLGRSSTTGELVTGSPTERVLQAQGVSLGGGKTGMDLVLEETIQMGQFEKRFGGLKGMARSVHFRDLSKRKGIRKALGISGEELKSFGAIGRLSDIEKNPALKRMQEFSGLVLEANYLDNPIARGFAANPQSVLGHFEKSSDPRAAMEIFATRMGLEPGSIGYNRVFGSEATVGISRLHFGGTKEGTGAGKMGTLEPRILTLLQAQDDKFSSELSSDLVSRIIKDSPERLGYHSELRKTLQSISNSNQDGVDITKLDSTEIQRIRREGGYVKTGIHDIPSIYMPASDIATDLRPSMIDGRLVETSETSKILTEMQRYITDRPVGDTEEMAMAKFTGEDGFLSRLYKEYAPAGKGEGSLARGKLYGSRFLTAVSEDSELLQRIGKFGLDKTRTVGIPKAYGEQMIRELSDRGEDVGDMLERFLKGEPVQGAIARHPFIGPYSMQGVNMLMTNSSEPILAIPERNIGLSFKGIGDEVISNGLLTGLALDKDADIPMAIMVNKKMEEVVRSNIMDVGSRNMYADHMVRMQLAKAKVFTNIGEEGVSRAEQIASAATKLGITDEYVGRVSAQLSTARAAVVTSNMDKETKLRSLGLLEWLEQQPISGKHLSTKKVLQGAFQKQMESLISGATGDPSLMKNTIEEMLRIETDGITDPDKLLKAQKRQNLIRGILGEGLELEQETSIAGVKKSSIKGYGIDELLPKIATAIQESKITQAGGLSPYQIEKWMSPGKFAQMNISQIDSMLSATNVMDPGTKGFALVQRNMLSGINDAAREISSRVKPFAKPAMVALAAAGAMAFLTSGPPTTMSGSDLPSTLGSGTFRNRPSNLQEMQNRSRDEMSIPQLEQQVLGQPTMPQSIQNSSTQLSSSYAKSRDIKMEISAHNLNRKQREQLVSRVSSRYPGRMHVNVNDNRRSLNEWSVTDMMD